jgi:hypothetical protein
VKFCYLLQHNYYSTYFYLENTPGHVSDKSLEGYIANTNVMKNEAASALSFNSAARVPKPVVPDVAVVGKSAIAPIYNITITNCPGVNITMGGIGKTEES